MKGIRKGTKDKLNIEEERRIRIDWFSINLSVPTDEEATKFIDKLENLCNFHAKDGVAYSFNFNVEG